MVAGRWDVRASVVSPILTWNIEPFVVQADPEEPDHWNPGPPPPDLPEPIWPDPGAAAKGFRVASTAESRWGPDPSRPRAGSRSWTFKGKGDGYDGLNAWTQSYDEAYWEGPIVARGEVRVDFKVADEFGNTFPVAAKTEVAVLPREGSEWDWDEEHWEFRADQPPSVPFVVPFVGADSIRLGVNCNYPECDGAYRVQPDVETALSEGYTGSSVPPGPNQGLWYVTGVSFHMDRQSQVNPQVRPGGIVFPRPQEQATECDAGELSFYEFNKACKSLDVDGMIAGIMADEGFGTGGNGNGHEAQGRAEASKPENDIRGRAEGAVRGTESQLEMLLRNLLEFPAAEIYSAGADDPTGNWTGQMWGWSPDADAYESLPFWNF